MNFDPSTQVWKIYTLICSFREKNVMFDLKQYRGDIFHGTREWCKIWRKTDLWFGKFSRKCMSLKFTGELYVMTMKKDGKRID